MQHDLALPPTSYAIAKWQYYHCKNKVVNYNLLVNVSSL